MWHRLDEQQLREKEERDYRRWLELRQRGPRMWLIGANVLTDLVAAVAFIGSCVAFSLGAIGWGWFGAVVAAAGLIAAGLLARETTAGECGTCAITLAAFSAACYVFVGVACVAGSAASACS